MAALSWDAFWFCFAETETSYTEGDISCQKLVSFGLHMMEEEEQHVWGFRLCPALQRAKAELRPRLQPPAGWTGDPVMICE